MNRSIAKVYVFVIVLFALLVVWTSRWTVFSQGALNANPLNQLAYFATLKVKRGRILADDGTTVLARSVRATGGTYTRTYPLGSLFAQEVGYGNLQQEQFSGLEGQYRAQLEARQEGTFSSVFGPISTSNVGDDLYTTLNVKAQKLARELLAGREGSVVAIEPSTGDVVAMYSNPTYNDNEPLNTPCSPADVSDGDLNPGGYASCQVNLATQGAFVPGSTFKLVTTAAALNTGKYTPDSVINGNSPITVSGIPLENDDGTSYGDVTLTDALTNSINTVYAQVGLSVGRRLMTDYMERFGFYRPPPIDLPARTVNPSGEFYIPHGKPARDGYFIKPTNTYVDLGRMSIGQDKLQVTPLQMAMVVSAIADGGKLMDPRLATKVVNQDGQVTQTIAPKLDDTVMTRKTSSEMIQMMTDVVEEGTGQAANLGNLRGEVAGKTGTASTGGSFDGQPLDDAWFVGLAPVSAPKIAVAVVLRNIPNGYGGKYSAPIAAQMMQALLQQGL